MGHNITKFHWQEYLTMINHLKGIHFLLLLLQDKFAKLPPPGGKQQKRRRIANAIKQRMRKTARTSLIPTFEEFIEYVVCGRVNFI